MSTVESNQSLILGSVGVGLGAISFLYIARSTFAKYINKITTLFSKEVKTEVVEKDITDVEVQFQNMATLHIDAADLQAVQQILTLMKTQYAIATDTRDTQG